MKKYITIAALLVAGTAFANAATLAPIDTEDSTLKAYWDFSTNSNPVVGGSVWNGLPTWVEDGQYGLANTTTHPYTTSAELSTSGFTVSFDVKSITQNGTLLSMTSATADQGYMNAAWRSLSVTYIDGTLSAKFHGTPNNAITVSNFDSSAWTTLTLVGSVNEDKALTLALYKDGKSVGTSTTTGATNFYNATINGMQFGYLGTSAENVGISDGSANMSLDNILVYNRAFTATEVMAHIIPEPSAFGLLAGLGALALVGTRRRRK